MSGWIFARGREAEQTLSEIVAARVQTIALVDADLIFSVGDTLFISESDDSEAQWLGRVTAVTGSQVSFSRELASSKNTGAKLWRAADTIATPADTVHPEKRRLETGVATERSLGGTFYAMQVADPLWSERLRIDRLTPAAEEALREWLATETDWGLEAFTLIDPAGDLRVVRLGGEPVEQARDKGGRIEWTLPLVIVEEGSYQ